MNRFDEPRDFKVLKSDIQPERIADFEKTFALAPGTVANLPDSSIVMHSLYDSWDALKAEMDKNAKPEVAQAFGNYLHDLQSTGVSNILSMMKQVELTGKKMSLDDGLELMNAAYSLDNHARSFSMMPFDNATVLEAKKFDWQI